MKTEPYYAVIFSSQRNAHDDEGYAQMTARMLELAQRQPGYLGMESVRGADGRGITVSYWKSEQAVADWHRNAEHQDAQGRGRREWYAALKVRVCRVEREYGSLELE